MKTYNKNVLLFLTLLVWANSIFAAQGLNICNEWWIDASVASYHTNREAHYNEFNPGIGIECGLTSNKRLVFGEYKNSIRRRSDYIGLAYTPFQLWGVKAGATFGFISGYSDSFKPMILPTLSVEGKQYGINLIIIPPGILDTGVIGLQVKYKWQ